MKQLIAKRVGLESFVEKLDLVSKHDLYTLAAQKPQLRFPSPDVMMLDYEFTALFKQLEGERVCGSSSKFLRCDGGEGLVGLFSCHT